MPDHKLHITLDWLLLQKPFPEVHRFMDIFQPVLQSDHRMLHHDLNTVRYIEEKLGTEAALSSIFHILLDKVSDEVGQENSVYALLQLLAKNDPQELLKYMDDTSAAITTPQ